MALVKFELKKEHIILLKYLDWELLDNELIVTSLQEGAMSPFGGLDLIEDIGVMIYGKPEGEFDPESYESPKYSEEQISFMKEIFSQLPMALEIILFRESFELGFFKRKWNLKNWKKYE